MTSPRDPHPFTVDPHDDYRCLVCRQPRALHPEPEPPEPPPELPAPPREGHHKPGRKPNAD